MLKNSEIFIHSILLYKKNASIHFSKIHMKIDDRYCHQRLRLKDQKKKERIPMPRNDE